MITRFSLKKWVSDEEGEMSNPENLWKLMQVNFKAGLVFTGYLDTFRAAAYHNKGFSEICAMCDKIYYRIRKAQAKEDQFKHPTSLYATKPNVLGKGSVSQLSQV